MLSISFNLNLTWIDIVMHMLLTEKKYFRAANKPWKAICSSFPSFMHVYMAHITIYTILSCLYINNGSHGWFTSIYIGYLPLEY